MIAYAMCQNSGFSVQNGIFCVFCVSWGVLLGIKAGSNYFRNLWHENSKNPLQFLKTHVRIATKQKQ